MDDLISRSALIEKLKEKSIVDGVNILSTTYTYKELAYIICNMPTAYDEEKVVAELEKMRNEDSQGCKRVQGWKCHSYSDCGLCIMDRTIDIVRKGGVE